MSCCSTWPRASLVTPPRGYVISLVCGCRKIACIWPSPRSASWARIYDCLSTRNGSLCRIAHRRGEPLAMFTGIIAAVGQVRSMVVATGDARLVIAKDQMVFAGAAIGESIAVNGVCLTAVAILPPAFTADVSTETLSHTTLGSLRPGQPVNLERALTLNTPLGGHLVAGHVDGVGEILAIEPVARSWRLTVRAPTALARYIAAKGSLAIDGVSLTVNTVSGADFTVNIVPHTFAATIMPTYRVGTLVNLEVDLIARYLERLLLGEQVTPQRQGNGNSNGNSNSNSNSNGIDRAFLQAHGWMT